MTNSTTGKTLTARKALRSAGRPAARWASVERADGTRRLEMTWSVRKATVPTQPGAR